MIEKIVWLAARKGMTQGELERAVGLALHRVSKWKQEKGEPTFRQMVRIAEFFEVPLSYLADDSLNEPPASKPELCGEEIAAVELFREVRDKIGAGRALAEIAKTAAKITGQTVRVPLIPPAPSPSLAKGGAVRDRTPKFAEEEKVERAKAKAKTSVSKGKRGSKRTDRDDPVGSRS